MTARLTDHVLLGQVVRFGLVGVLNTGAYYGAYLALRQVLPYLAAHVLAFLLSMCVAFLLHSWLTYRVRPTWRAFLLFPLTVAANFVITTVGVGLLVEVVGVDERPAPLLAALAAIPVTFLVTRAVLVGRRP
ncbi:MAG: sugar transferase [Frankiales bacterium]|nr:sugar transferase [Frankiales bacterium]